MRVLLSEGDPIRLGFLQALLRDGGLRPLLLDSHMSAVEGRIGAFPQRLAVPEEEAAAAESLLREAGEWRLG
ncbi:DUF2007 domain-containing protein [Roseomonas nepalensis]|uniref:DUF2007 domain-containing protein n=1 Tax=Muricoccus nepalensis TaxID=1854500 RepID=A0A502GCN4_9PROT|nr:DUF2007 domain-containing protein [Roseomonas nepalensis]TPG59849.1 DUF2007 domain-containing protein [Roseomonas nepalensis]